MVKVSELDLELLFQLCVVLEGRQAQSLWETKGGLFVSVACEASHRDSWKIRKQRGGGGSPFSPRCWMSLAAIGRKEKKKEWTKKGKREVLKILKKN